MTLEKLLIFGFALAVVIALTVSATTLMKNRKPSNDHFETEVKDLVGKAK